MRVKWRRLFIFPRARVLAFEGRTAHLQVEGLVCDLCAARVRRGLLSLPQVREAQVDLEGGTATVHLQGPVADEALVRAVHRQVIWPWARCLLALVPFLGRR